MQHLHLKPLRDREEQENREAEKRAAAEKAAVRHLKMSYTLNVVKICCLNVVKNCCRNKISEGRQWSSFNPSGYLLVSLSKTLSSHSTG